MNNFDIMGPRLNSIIPAFTNRKWRHYKIKFADMCRVRQLSVCFMGLIMSHSGQESPDSIMDFSQVEITNVSKNFYFMCKIFSLDILGAQLGRGGRGIHRGYFPGWSKLLVLCLIIVMCIGIIRCGRWWCDTQQHTKWGKIIKLIILYGFYY